MVAIFLTALIAAGPTIPLEGKFEKTLSAYHIFEDPANQIPVDGFVPYDLAVPLFTDYAEKFRWIYIPPETTITYNPDETFAFPIGTVIVKTFAYPGNTVSAVAGLPASPSERSREVGTEPTPRPQVSTTPTSTTTSATEPSSAFPQVGERAGVRGHPSESTLDPTNQPSPRLIETRLLIHQTDGWVAAAYLWNDAQTDAILKVAGARVPITFTDPAGHQHTTDYLVPNMNQCKACHRGTGTMQPIGPKARHLNKGFEYVTGEENQLAHWANLGILQGLPKDVAGLSASPSKRSREVETEHPSDSASTPTRSGPNVLPALPHVPAMNDPTAPLDLRAKAYLDINCAHCHNPNGLASITRLDLRWIQNDPLMRGILKRPTSAGPASADHYYAIQPGRPDDSFLLTRLGSTHPDIRMPEVGRTLVHEEAVELIRAWITSLK